MKNAGTRCDMTTPSTTTMVSRLEAYSLPARWPASSSPTGTPAETPSPGCRLSPARRAGRQVVGYLLGAGEQRGASAKAIVHVRTKPSTRHHGAHADERGGRARRRHRLLGVDPCQCERHLIHAGVFADDGKLEVEPGRPPARRDGSPRQRLRARCGSGVCGSKGSLRWYAVDAGVAAAYADLGSLARAAARRQGLRWRGRAGARARHHLLSTRRPR